MFRLNVISRAALAITLAGLWAHSYASGAELFSKHRISASSAWETTPTLGADANSDIVVFTLRGIMPDSSFAPADIYLHRLDNGAPTGPLFQVTAGNTDDKLNDISGNYIVYTEYESTTTAGGRITLYRLSTDQLLPIDSGAALQEARISGKHVVWSEGTSFNTRLMYFNIDWLTTGDTAIVLAGPTPPIFTPEIGSRFVVWSEYVSGDYNVRAYDLEHGWTFDVAVEPGVDEVEPTTDGPRVVFQRWDSGHTEAIIESTNFDTFETITIADNGAGNYRPSISGDLVSYESTIGGDLDVILYEFGHGLSAMINDDDTLNNYLNNVFENLAAWVERPTGNEDVFVATLPKSFCCIGRVGNVDEDFDDQVNVSDLTQLVAYLFQGAPEPDCSGEANVDGSLDGNINVSDLTFLVAYLFQGGAELPRCDPAGDDIEPGLLAEWDINSVTHNGVTVPLAAVLDFEPGAVMATYMFTPDGHYLYQEKDAAQTAVWTEGGLFGMAGNHAVSHHTTTNGLPYPGNYALNKVALNGTTMTLTTISKGNILVFSLSH